MVNQYKAVLIKACRECPYFEWHQRISKKKWWQFWRIKYPSSRPFCGIKNYNLKVYQGTYPFSWTTSTPSWCPLNSIEQSQWEQLRLIEKHKELKRQYHIIQECLKEKNLELDAVHRIWCTGCENGAHRHSENTITEELVQTAELYVKRLRVWWEGHQYRKEHENDTGCSRS